MIRFCGKHQANMILSPLKKMVSRKKYPKRHLLYNISEVYGLFLEQNRSKQLNFSFLSISSDSHIESESIFLATLSKTKEYYPLQNCRLSASLTSIFLTFAFESNNNNTLDMSIGRSSFAKLRPKYVLYKNTLAHRMCLCIVHENIHLLLEALAEEIDGLSNNLNDYAKKTVRGETKESCKMSSCDNCKFSFDDHILKKITKKEKPLEWFQWMNCRGRAEKKVFRGMNIYISLPLQCVYIVFAAGTVLQCVKTLQEKTLKYLVHIFIKRKQSNFLIMSQRMQAIIQSYVKLIMQKTSRYVIKIEYNQPIGRVNRFPYLQLMPGLVEVVAKDSRSHLYRILQNTTNILSLLV